MDVELGLGMWCGYLGVMVWVIEGGLGVCCIGDCNGVRF